MPSWAVHLATATEVNKLLNVDKNSFLIGNLIPDAERYVVNDFSIYVPYSVSHFADIQDIDGKKEKMPNIEVFIKKYKNQLNNPIVLGYLVHLLADYHWNKVAYSRYTIADENGNCIGVKLNDGTKVNCTLKERADIKHHDFDIFRDYIINMQKFDIPHYEPKLMNEIKAIEEIPFNEDDINKIIKYLNEHCVDKRELGEYKQFTREQIEKDYEDSIKFIIDYLKRNILK